MSWNATPTGMKVGRAGGSPGRASDALSTTADRETLAILRNPDFETLVRERTAFGWILSLVMLAVYLAFIFLVAFSPELMGSKVFGSEISLGIVLGLGVIILAVILTGLYVLRANSRFDELNDALQQGRRS